MYSIIQCCRICGNKNLVSLLHLGEQALTGVFPRSKKDHITVGPLELVKCEPTDENPEVCHLVQLRHSYDLSEMYGMNYGYRSGLNQSMVKHLQSIAKRALEIAQIEENDLIIDIGSNDSTLLQTYPSHYQLLGIDPTGIKFQKYYPEHIALVPDFFSAKNIKQKVGNKKAKIITSIAMFYDLEQPQEFVNEIAQVLDKDGIWIFEQSYLPAMLETNSYDTICHEHLEFYALYQIEWLLKNAGLKLVDVETNKVNGGSFRLTATHQGSSVQVLEDKIQAFRENEIRLGLNTLNPYKEFLSNVEKHKNELLNLLRKLKQEGKKVLGYGASTKGNVLLQYCGIDSQMLPCIAEVNEDKFGAYTPQTHILMVSEAEAKAQKPDYFLVLPWHFRDSILEREKDFLAQGGKFIFPLPHIEIVG